MKKLPPFELDIAVSLSAWVELMKAFTKIRSRELDLIEANGLTIGQFGVLELLHHRGPQSVGAATKLAMSTPGNMTVVVKNLAKRGLITTRKDDRDKRTVILTITDTGTDLIARMFPEHARRIDSYMGGLDRDEQQTLRQLLRKLHKALK